MAVGIESSRSSVCQVCGTLCLRQIEGFGLLPRITSDCRLYSAGGRLFVCIACGSVQKVPDERWLEEVAGIYANYEVYHQSGGDEQIVFDRVTGKPRRRSDVILERLVANEPLKTQGHALDVGCGNGATLSAMGAALPGWHFSGYELGDSALPRLSRIHNFTKLYTGPLEAIDGTFDLVTLIHSLEHFRAPAKTLIRLRAIVGDGKLVVQVCNVDENPFDILVADHLMHFSPSTLGHLLRRAGFEVVSVATDWVPKEISLVSKLARDGPEEPYSKVGGETTSGETMYRRMANYIEWLKEMVRRAGELAGEEKPFGMFGTSIAATWLAGQLQERVSFFVDEDESRIGKEHLGRPIRRPNDIPLGATVYLALAPGIASLIAARLASLPCRFVSPPPMRQSIS
jgi:SAM-dependent methyltransferase